MSFTNISIPPKFFFDSVSARDAYFNTHPADLVDGVIVGIKAGNSTVFQLQQYSGPGGIVVPDPGPDPGPDPVDPGALDEITERVEEIESTVEDLHDAVDTLEASVNTVEGSLDALSDGKIDKSILSDSWDASNGDWMITSANIAPDGSDPTHKFNIQMYYVNLVNKTNKLENMIVEAGAGLKFSYTDGANRTLRIETD
jgi:hypothetical protein